MSIYGGQPVAVNENLALEDFGYSFGQTLKATAETVFSENPLTSLMDAADFAIARNTDTARKLSRNEALAITGRENLSVDVPEDGISRPGLDVLMERERERIRRDHVFANPDFEPGAGTVAAQVGVGLAVSVTDPLNLLTAMVPAFGLAKMARTSTQVANTIRQAPVATAVGEAVTGAALAEAVVLPSQNYLRSDYDAYDSLLNIGLGAFMAGGIQGVARGFNAAGAARLKRALEIHDEIGQNTRRVIETARSRGRPTTEVLDEVEARRTETTDQRISDKMLNASTETKEAVFRAILARAVQGKDLDIETILDADINALAGRQLFEMDELETTLNDHFDEALDDLRKLTDEQFLGKRKLQRNKKQIKELQDNIDRLYSKEPWVDYRRAARQKLGSRASKKAIRRLAQRYQEADERAVLRSIDKLRDRIQQGRAAKPVKEALDRLQQRTEEYGIIKEMVVRNAQRLQQKINEHPESVKRLAQLRESALDPENTIYRNEQTQRIADEALEEPDPDIDDIEAQINGLDSELEDLSETIDQTYPDSDFPDVVKAANRVEDEYRQKAEGIRDSAACMAR